MEIQTTRVTSGFFIEDKFLNFKFFVNSCYKTKKIYRIYLWEMVQYDIINFYGMIS